MAGGVYQLIKAIFQFSEITEFHDSIFQPYTLKL